MSNNPLLLKQNNIELISEELEINPATEGKLCFNVIFEVLQLSLVMPQ